MGTLYVPARIMDKPWAEKFVQGQIFMRSLTDFGAWEAVKRHNDSELNNSFRGDLFEGAVKTVADPNEDRFFRAFPVVWRQMIKSGAILDAGDIQYFNTLCLCCVDYIPQLQRFVPPSEKMKAFGDTAVVIKDMNEFIRRFMVGLEKNCPHVCVMLDKVEYYSRTETRCLNPLFNKSDFYKYQNELRLAVGRLDPNSPTSGEKYEIFKSSAPLILEIGSISDITETMSVGDFCRLRQMESPIFPMLDYRNDIFNRLMEDTRKRMTEFESRRQTLIFSI